MPAESDERPLGSYGAVMSVYGALFAAFALFLRRTGRQPPERLNVQDMALVALATNKVSRLVSRDKVTSPLRAPFTEIEEEPGSGQGEEKPAGAGPRRAVGELLICPFCIAQWVATAFVFGLVLAPRATRVIASTFAALTGADFLQMAYALAEKKASA